MTERQSISLNALRAVWVATLEGVIGRPVSTIDWTSFRDQSHFLKVAEERLDGSGFGNEQIALLLIRCLSESQLAPEVMTALFYRAFQSGMTELAVATGEALYGLGYLSPPDKVSLAEAHHWNGDSDRAILLASEVEEQSLRAVALLCEIGLSSAFGWAEDYALRVFSSRHRRAGGQQRRVATAYLATPDATLDGTRWRGVCDNGSQELRMWAAAMLLNAGSHLPVDLLSFDYVPNELDRRLWAAQHRYIRDRNFNSIVGQLNGLFREAGLSAIGLNATSSANCLSKLKRLHEGQHSGPLVSVIMTAKDAEGTIEYAVKSIVDQDYDNIEIIVVDDGSAEPLAEQPLLTAGVTKLLRNPAAIGPYESRNVGLSVARGELIAFQDADDWAHPSKISRQVQYLRGAADADACYTRHVRMDQNGNLRLENSFSFLGDGPVTSLIRRRLFDVVGPFASVMSRGDVEFKARIMATRGPMSVLNDEAVCLVALDWHSHSKKAVSGAGLAQIKMFKRRYVAEHRLSSFSPSRGDAIIGNLLELSDAS